MKYCAVVALLILLAQPSRAAEGLMVWCDDKSCVMPLDTFVRVQGYIQALTERLDKLMNTTGCS